MVIIVPVPKKIKQELGDPIATLLIFLLPFIAPQVLMLGIAVLIYDFWTVGGGIGCIVGGSIVILITIILLAILEKNARDCQDRFLKNYLLVLITVFGTVEFIIGLIIKTETILITILHTILIGAGLILALPPLLYLIFLGIEKITKKEETKQEETKQVDYFQSNETHLTSVEIENILKLFTYDYAEIEPTLIKMLSGGTVAKRLLVITELGKVGKKKSSKLLQSYMKDEDKYVRRRVAEALGRIGDTQVIDQLKLISQEEQDEETKTRIQKAIFLLECIK